MALLDILSLITTQLVHQIFHFGTKTIFFVHLAQKNDNNVTYQFLETPCDSNCYINLTIPKLESLKTSNTDNITGTNFNQFPFECYSKILNHIQILYLNEMITILILLGQVLLQI